MKLRFAGSGRGQVLAPARGRARGRAVYSRTPAMYSGYDQGYEQGYGMYDQGAGAYDQGYADSGLAYGGYGAVAPVAAAAASPAGMTMVPMMLPTGQASDLHVSNGINSSESSLCSLCMAMYARNYFRMLPAGCNLGFLSLLVFVNGQGQVCWGLNVG